jgi:hypothetical protein
MWTLPAPCILLRWHGAGLEAGKRLRLLCNQDGEQDGNRPLSSWGKRQQLGRTGEGPRQGRERLGPASTLRLRRLVRGRRGARPRTHAPLLLTIVPRMILCAHYNRPELARRGYRIRARLCMKLPPLGTSTEVIYMADQYSVAIMGRTRLKRLRQRIDNLRRRGGIKPRELEAIAKALGRKLGPSGKHPMWVTDRAGSHPIAIPHHAHLDLNRFTAQHILDQLEADIDEIEGYGDEESGG